MKCDEAKRRIDLFIDGELPVSENMQVLEHLNDCSACAGVYEGEKKLRSTFRAQLATVRAPVQLTKRITMAIRPAQETKRNKWRALLAAGVIFTVVAVILLAPVAEQPRALAAEVVRHHEVDREGFACAKTPDRRCLCSACSDDGSADADAFFKEHGCLFGCCDFGLGKLGYTTVGVSRWTWKGREVCCAVRRTPSGKAVSYARYTDPLAMDPDEVRFFKQGGRGVVFIPSEAGVTCVFVFDSADEARTFVGAVEMERDR
jgi:anti-sigma factor (TIGR02949 family)